MQATGYGVFDMGPAGVLVTFSSPMSSVLDEQCEFRYAIVEAQPFVPGKSRSPRPVVSGLRWFFLLSVCLEN